MEKVFNLGKIDWDESGRKINKVTVNVKLEECGGAPTFTYEQPDKPGALLKKVPTGNYTPKYYGFTASCDVWNSKETDIICGGQFFDLLTEYKKDFTDENSELFDKIYKYWKRYHLNGMHAGTPEQEELIMEWLREGNEYDYEKACNMLKEKGMYEAPYTGKSTSRCYYNEPYRYGSSWLVDDIPVADLRDIIDMIRG